MDEPRQPKTGKQASESDRAKTRRERLRRYQMDILGAAAHEGWHQYFHWYVVSWVELSPWVNEGMGDYFYCARPSAKGGPTQFGRINGTRMPRIHAMVKRDAHIPLRDFVLMSKEDYYNDPANCYSQGWALCHFLQHSGNKRYARVLPKFIKLAKSDGNMDEVNRKALRGIDLDKLEAEWKAWVLGEGIDAYQAELRADAGIVRKVDKTDKGR